MTSLAHDDTGGSGRLAVMLPGAGDVRSEYRFLVGPLVAAGFRVVTADLPGHGESATVDRYTVASTAYALIGLIESLGAGPATVVSCSFAPAAAVWAAAERPDLVSGIVALSPYFTADRSLKGRALNAVVKLMLRGPWAAGAWAKLYAGWYKTNPPSDLANEIGKMTTMLANSSRRRAVRETLTADRDGVAEKMEAITIPILVVFGSLDDHFTDPAAEATTVAGQLRGQRLIVDGAGHYPHVERPDMVSEAIVAFLEN